MEPSLDTFFKSTSKNQFEELARTLKPQLIEESPNMVILIRYVDDLDWLSSELVLKTLLLCLRIAGSPRFIATFSSYSFSQIDVGLPSELSKTEQTFYMLLVRKILVFMDEVKKQEQDVVKELNVLAGNASEFNFILKSKNYHILALFDCVEGLTVSRWKQLRDTVEREIRDVECKNNQQFLQFYKLYCMFCGLNKKLTYVKTSAIKYHPIDTQVNAKIERIKQKFAV